MNRQSLERAKQQWEFAADSMPQFICLLDRDGRVIRANRTVERWKLGIDIEDVGGLRLHDVLHRDCDNSRCYLKRFGARAAVGLAKGRRANCDAWDPILKRHFLIRARKPIVTQQRKHPTLSEVFAVVTIDDMTDWVKAEEALRASQSESRRLAVQHLTIQETERRRIAADLHDGLGQSLSLLKLGIREVLKQMGVDAPRIAVEVVKRLIHKVQDALNELRRVVMDLRPSTLDDLGILPTLSWFVREFEIVNPNTRIEKHVRVSELDVPEPLKLAIFRILQEAVNNTIKHADADCIRISLYREDDILAFTIEDNGKGFDPVALASRGAARTGLGMQSMRERAELSGGSYAVTSVVGQGTKVCARWPAFKATGGYHKHTGRALSGRRSDATGDGVEVRAS
jgi:signal transduction histidine kinase